MLRSVEALPLGTTSPRNDTLSLPPSIKEEHSDAQPSSATIGVVALQKQGPSSLSVTIEDEKGNLIEISRVEGDKPVDRATSTLQTREGAGHIVLIWHGMDQSKGFILHRSEKGKEIYTPVSGLIPYFGRDGKEIFRYRFTDNSVKPGVKYEYRL